MAHAELYRIQIKDLKITDGDEELLKQRVSISSWRVASESALPVVRFTSFAFAVPDRVIEEKDTNRIVAFVGDLWLVVDLQESAKGDGFIDVLSESGDSWNTIACEMNASRLQECDQEESERLWKWYAQEQLRTGARGRLWLQSKAGKEADETPMSFNRTFSTLSGGRALAENLALDRALILGEGEDKKKVAISEIKGVTVAPIPWEGKLPKGEVAVDALSKYVPEDQHVLVVPSLKNLFALIDRLEGAGTPILRSFAVGDDYRELPTRYRRQMGLDLPDALARFLPVKSVAVTGGDPFFPTGSDVAVILETDKADFLYASLENAIGAKAKLAGAKEVVGEGGFGFENETRSFSCHLAKLSGAVVIANSRVQISRIQQVAEGKVPALGETDEYRFFRHRYPMGDKESAYVFISDACLRRWSGPEVRIGASRRSRSIAALGAITSRHIETGKIDETFAPLLGEVTRVDERILSSKYGSLGFVTPIGELGMTMVTSREKEGYERWRRGYENGWARFFDPIAIQFKLTEESEALDMTVLPLRVGGDYEDIVSLAGKVVLSKASQQAPGESAFHFAMAVDKESEIYKVTNFKLIDVLPALKIDSLGWMGDSFSVTLGEDLVWRGNLGMQSLKDMPILLRVDVKSRLKLALFMTAVKAAIEVSGPDLVRWETRRHLDRKYVAMVGDPEEMGADVSLYYATLPTGLLVSLNEEMLKRAIDREEKVKRGQKGNEQVALLTSPQFLTSFGEAMASQTMEEKRRSLSFRALPVLNEWYKNHGAKDPQKFHQQRYVEPLTCPGGLGYRWNAEDLTMESIAYGHPGRPLDHAKPLAIFKGFQTMRMGGSFEDGGMRMKVAMEKQSSYVAPGVKGKARPSDDEVIAYCDLHPMTPGMVIRVERKIEHLQVDDADIQQTEVTVNEVVQKGDLRLVKETHRTVLDGEESSEVYQYEVGTKGIRVLAIEGEEKLIPDPNSYDFPGELWPGQIFRVQKNEAWIPDGKKERLLTDSVVKVVGWEEIEGPAGEKLKALKIVSQSATAFGRDFNRSTSTGWYARGLGLVKFEDRSNFALVRGKVTRITMPEKK